MPKDAEQTGTTLTPEGKPRNIAEYQTWLKQKHGVEVDTLLLNYYMSVTSKMRSDFLASPFWVQFTDNFGRYSQEYLQATSYDLLVHSEPPEVHVKPFDSLLLKTFRKNVLQNGRWPAAPQGDWVLPSNWYSRIGDVVRTTVVVKYLDGSEFITKKADELCQKENLTLETFYEAREEGYYAIHLYVDQKFEIPRVDWDTAIITGAVEIQVTTQLQEVIRRMLHKYYESRRVTEKEREQKWQWDYRSDEFLANYLGHILHYVEGMIMDIRERQKGKAL